MYKLYICTRKNVQRINRKCKSFSIGWQSYKKSTSVKATIFFFLSWKEKAKEESKDDMSERGGGKAGGTVAKVL